MWEKLLLFIFLVLAIISITLLSSCMNDEPPNCGCEFSSGDVVLDTGYVNVGFNTNRVPYGTYFLCNEEILDGFEDQVTIVEVESAVPCPDDSVTRYIVNEISSYQIQVPEITEEEYDIYLAVLRHFYPDSTFFTIWESTGQEIVSVPTYLYDSKFPIKLAIDFFHYEKEVTSLNVMDFTDPDIDVVLVDEQDLEEVNSNPWWIAPEFFEVYQGTNGMNFFSRVAIKENNAMLYYKRVVSGASGEDFHILLKNNTEGWQVIKVVVWSQFGG